MALMSLIRNSNWVTVPQLVRRFVRETLLELYITPLQKGQWYVVCCVCTSCTHNIQRPFTLFAGHTCI
jgi:hypothetical protein